MNDEANDGGGGNLKSFYGYKNTFSKTQPWVQIPGKCESEITPSIVVSMRLALSVLCPRPALCVAHCPICAKSRVARCLLTYVNTQ